MSDKLPCEECHTPSTPLPQRNKDGAHVCIKCLLRERGQGTEDEEVLDRYEKRLEKQQRALRNFSKGDKVDAE